MIADLQTFNTRLYEFLHMTELLKPTMSSRRGMRRVLLRVQSFLVNF